MNYRRLFALSAQIGELVQQKTRDPADGTMVLMITLGRIAAREGFSDLSSESFRSVFLQDHIWAAFKAGFDEERAQGNMGRPRGN